MAKVMYSGRVLVLHNIVKNAAKNCFREAMGSGKL